MRSCIPNRTKLEITTEIGIIILGKYTFPKIPAFALNVFEVPEKHDLK